MSLSSSFTLVLCLISLHTWPRHTERLWRSAVDSPLLFGFILIGSVSHQLGNVVQSLNLTISYDSVFIIFCISAVEQSSTIITHFPLSITAWLCRPFHARTFDMFAVLHNGVLNVLLSLWWHPTEIFSLFDLLILGPILLTWINFNPIVNK